MKLPNKVTSYSESILCKIPAVLDLVRDRDMTISELYNETQTIYVSCSDFIDVLDCLFALKKIEYIDNSEVIHYVA